jgi:tetratricopeptide (TPR) repeat protein
MRAVAVLLAAAVTAGGLPIQAAGQTPNTAQNCAVAAVGSVWWTRLNCGFTSAEVAGLIASVPADDQKQITAQNEAILKLSGEIGLTEGAVRAVLSSLGKDQATIPRERLADALSAEMGQILAMRQGLTRPNNDAPEIAALKQRAVAELDAGHFAEADRLLEDIHAREHAIDEGRAKAVAAARADWLAALQAEADTSALLARSALRQRNGTRAVARFDDGIRTLAPMDAEARWSYALDAATALQQFGDLAGNNIALAGAIRIWRVALVDVSRADNDWARTQNNLGTVLQTLGARENGTAHLEEAVTAFRAALEEWTRDWVPLNWAGAQNNLGLALQTLGQRESGTARLEAAVAAYRAALEEWTNIVDMTAVLSSMARTDTQSRPTWSPAPAPTSVGTFCASANTLSTWATRRHRSTRNRSRSRSTEQIRRPSHTQQAAAPVIQLVGDFRAYPQPTSR